MNPLNKPLQIALVDDHKLFRTGIAQLIAQIEGFNVIFEASNGQELIDRVKPKTMPDIVLLDINMPGMDGFIGAEWLKKNYPDVKIIVLSMHGDPEKITRMLKLGVNGYLLKDAEPDEFEHALKKVAENDFFFPPFVTKYLMGNYIKADDGIKLSQRELDFLKLTGTELTYREIADKMNVSVRTVDGYRDQLFEKLDVKSRVGLAMYAIKNQYVQL
ncbi:response regulator transcription factor [Mucilaginibacter ginkgonis]|uniref:Response regulator transcription factor n=1 Tax=Mucilaginibacter ginkgonis TaxID=2682091 RepID=A0A6I4HXT7_9SPHI|nr:response regulator transcription factor [Mucilaginibacter ginkgonis]QQL49276.1 response regulator transcription factor [Mucilaginibacter ginkgonis]